MTEALELLIGLQAVSGAKAKHDFLLRHKDNENFRRLLYYACHPRLTYKLSEDTLSTSVPHPLDYIEFKDFFDVCETLAKRDSMSNWLLHSVIAWIENSGEAWERELYRQILTKTLRLGVTHKSINKAIPGLFPEWNVQQAYPIEKYPLKEGTWFCLTEKLNGVRCTYYKGQLIARSGEVFEGLDHILTDLCLWPDTVFDGELTLKSTSRGNMSDNEAFRKATGILNSDGDKSSIQFTIFDTLPTWQFEFGESARSYAERRVQLNRFSVSFTHSPNVSVLPCLYMGTNQTQIDRLLEQMVAEDKEGLMVNLDVPYKCKRHSGILKVKRFYTMDLPILRVEEGTGKYAGRMGNLVVDYKGNEVGVGTGFTDEQRDWFWAHRDELPGVLVEVKYKEVSANKKTGAESLQFPVFVGLRTDKTEVSYG